MQLCSFLMIVTDAWFLVLVEMNDGGMPRSVGHATAVIDQ
jgi:hypothetical protein